MYPILKGLSPSPTFHTHTPPYPYTLDPALGSFSSVKVKRLPLPFTYSGGRVPRATLASPNVLQGLGDNPTNRQVHSNRTHRYNSNKHGFKEARLEREADTSFLGLCPPSVRSPFKLRCHVSDRERQMRRTTHTHLADPPSCSVGPLRRDENGGGRKGETCSPFKATSRWGRPRSQLLSGNGNAYFAWTDSCSSVCSKMQWEAIK